MTDSAQPGELASLEPLEPLDTGDVAGQGAPTASMGDDAVLATLRAGLAPAFNPNCRDKTFYRFLFSGVIMLVGVLMPFSAELGRAGYQTMSGGFYTLLGIAMVWSWWAAIATNRPFGLKWLLWAAVPLIATSMNMAAFDASVAQQAAVAAGWVRPDMPFSADWKAMFGDIGSALAKNAEAAVRVEGFWRLFGPGQFFVFLGALMAEFGFFGGVIGGAKKNKADQKQKQMAAAERKRR